MRSFLLFFPFSSSRATRTKSLPGIACRGGLADSCTQDSQCLGNIYCLDPNGNPTGGNPGGCGYSIDDSGFGAVCDVSYTSLYVSLLALSEELMRLLHAIDESETGRVQWWNLPLFIRDV